MTDLDILAKLHGTNKSWHGYMSFYDKLFNNLKNMPIVLLEIGIENGGSLLSWKDYFKEGIIYGIDLNIPDKVKGVDRIITGVADQSNRDQLFQLMTNWNLPQYNIIIDDGGHTVRQQRISIETLWPLLKSDGYYIIEDLHTNIRSLHYIHPHLNKDSIHIDEQPTIHDRILNIMGGSDKEFIFPTSEIAEIYYFNCPITLSLSCALKKK
jgi:hypothetical protein